jgi:hypothetical protein
MTGRPRPSQSVASPESRRKAATIRLPATPHCRLQVALLDQFEIGWLLAEMSVPRVTVKKSTISTTRLMANLLGNQ